MTADALIYAEYTGADIIFKRIGYASGTFGRIVITMRTKRRLRRSRSLGKEIMRAR